jgi:uncharacterized protein (DUF58 family)
MAKMQSYNRNYRRQRFFFYRFPGDVDLCKCSDYLHAVCTYSRTLKESIANAAENAAKAKQAQIKALQTVISITTDETVLNALRAQLEMLQK